MGKKSEEEPRALLEREREESETAIDHENTRDLHGGERISALQTNYPDQDRDSYVPDASNIAPRRKGWKPKKSNTQMPPIKGKGSDEQPQVQVTRGPKYYGKLNKLL